MNDNEMFNPEKHGSNLKGSLIKILLKLNVKPSLANKLDDLDITDEVVNLMAPKIFPIDYDSPIANNINFLLKRIELVPNNYEVVDIIIHNKDKFIKENLSKLVNALYEHKDLFYQLLDSDVNMITYYTGTTFDNSYNRLICECDYFKLPEVVKKGNYYLVSRYRDDPNFLKILKDYIEKNSIERSYLDEIFNTIHDLKIEGYEDIISNFIEVDKEKTMKFLLSTNNTNLMKKFIEQYKENKDYVSKVLKDYPELLTIERFKVVDHKDRFEIINNYLSKTDAYNIKPEILEICDLRYENLEEHKQKILELITKGILKKGYFYESFVAKNINELDLNTINFTSNLFYSIPSKEREKFIYKLIEINKIQDLSEDTLNAIVGDITSINKEAYISQILPHEFYQAISQNEELRKKVINFQLDYELIDYKIFEENPNVFLELNENRKEKFIQCSIKDNIKLPKEILKFYFETNKFFMENGVISSNYIKKEYAKILKDYIEYGTGIVKISNDLLKNKEIYETLKNSSAKDRIIVSFVPQRDDPKHDLKFEDYIKAEDMMDIYVESLKPRVNKNGEKKELSQLEAVMAAYKLATHLGEYKFEAKDESHLASRDFHFFLRDVSKKNPIVCVGYASFMDELLKRAGYDVTECISVQAGAEGHRRLIVSIDDKKYGIKGVYTSDPTWSAITEGRMHNPRIIEREFAQFLLTHDQSKRKEAMYYGDDLETLINNKFSKDSLEEFFKKHGITYEDYENSTGEISQELKLELLKALDYFVDRNKPEYQRGMEDKEFDREMDEKNSINSERTKDNVHKLLDEANSNKPLKDVIFESEYKYVGSWIKKKIRETYGIKTRMAISVGTSYLICDFDISLQDNNLIEFFKSQGYEVEYDDELDSLQLKKAIKTDEESLYSLFKMSFELCNIINQYQNNIALNNEEQVTMKR